MTGEAEAGMDGARAAAVAAVRRAVKAAAAEAIHASGVRRLVATVRRTTAGGVRVLFVAYHRVVPDFEGLRRRVIPGLLTSVRTFDRQLRWLARHYRPASIDEALEVLAGRRREARDLCVVTFDDGYADFLAHAVPVLRRHGFPAILYVPTSILDGGVPLLHDRLYRLIRLAHRRRLVPGDIEGDARVRAALAGASFAEPIATLERALETCPRTGPVALAEALERRLGEAPEAALADSPLLGWEELKAIRALGFTVGAHTVDHACLPNEAPHEVDRQLRTSKERLEAELGCRVADFSYPNGWYSRGAIRALARHGYRSAVTTEDRANRGGDDPLRLQRKSVWEFTSRGLTGYSHAVTACNLDGTLHALGLSPWVPGERPDAAGAGPAGPTAGVTGGVAGGHGAASPEGA